MKKVKCPYCGEKAKLKTGAAIYPHRPDLKYVNVWNCSNCQAHVGCHRPNCGQGDGTKPLGRLANRELRYKKQMAHRSFDRLWKTGCSFANRKAAYKWLADKMKVTVNNCHIGMFDVDECEKVVTYSEKRYEDY